MEKKFIGVQFIISIAFTLVAVAGIIFVGSALYIPFYNSSMEMAATEQRQILEQVNLNLDRHLRSMMKISDTTYFKVIKNTNFSEKNIGEELSLLYDVYRDSFVSIALFTERGDVVAAAPLSNVKPSADITRQIWFVQAQNKIENLHFSTPHVQNIFENSDFQYPWVISLSRAVDLTYDGEIKRGVLLVDMNFSGIEQICRRVSLGDSGYVYIVDSGGEIIYHPSQQLIYAGLKDENITQAAAYKDGGHRENFEGRKQFLTVKTVGYTGWKIIGVSYIDEVSIYREIALFTALVIFFAIGLMILLNQYVSRRFISPLGEEKLKSELDALQSQINPHFLYNALDSIVWMIEKKNYQQAVVMVTSISRLFRIGISRGKNIITVGAELEHAKHYLTIQNIRFKNKFEYEIITDEDINSLSTIKLIVQPLIENAIYHGMEFMDGDGRITITGKIQGRELFIEVADNGMGMTQSLVKELLAAPAVKGSGSGIGLYNVHKRIQLYFGEQYGLRIESEPDVGTQITIHLPAVKYEEGEH